MMKPKASPWQWMREHPLLFGIVAGVALGVLILLGMVYDLPLVEWLIGRNIGWVRFSVYTIIIFAIVATNLRPKSPTIHFWNMFAGLLLLHLTGFVWFILRIKPLAAIHYVIAGPFEVLLLALLLNYGVRFLGTTQGGD